MIGKYLIINDNSLVVYYFKKAQNALQSTTYLQWKLIYLVFDENALGRFQ